MKEIQQLLLMLAMLIFVSMALTTFAAAAEENKGPITYIVVKNNEGTKDLVFHCDVGAPNVRWETQAVGSDAKENLKLFGASKTGLFTVKINNFEKWDRFGLVIYDEKRTPIAGKVVYRPELI